MNSLQIKKGLSVIVVYDVEASHERISEKKYFLSKGKNNFLSIVVFVIPSSYPLDVALEEVLIPF